MKPIVLKPIAPNYLIVQARVRIFIYVLVLAFGASSCKAPDGKNSSLFLDSEQVPQVVRFAAQTRSLDALRQVAKPSLSWVDSDGAPIFLWAKRANGEDRYSITLDQAHHVTGGGDSFWCFLEPSKDSGSKVQDPLTQFMMGKFVRTSIGFPNDERPDQNISYATLISTNIDGSAMLKIVYCSTSGERAHQEQVRTYLVCVSSEGSFHLAANDLGMKAIIRTDGLVRVTRLNLRLCGRKGQATFRPK